MRGGQHPSYSDPNRIRVAELEQNHWAEIQASGIAPDVAALNIQSFGPGTDRHWEDERAELVRHARLQIQTGSLTAKGLPQTQPGHLSERLLRLDRRYRHLQHGGWRSLSDALPGLEPFDQWKPAQGRWRHDKPGRSIKYEAPPAFPDGGGLLLPRIPERCWRLICERQGLPFPADRSGGFWAWALATPKLQLLICEGWKKALAALSAGWAAVALPGVTMGRRVDANGSDRLIEALALLAPSRRFLIAFDAEAKRSTARKVGSAAGRLARSLRAAGGWPEIARLPLLPGSEKTGLDDLLVFGGIDAVDLALANTGPLPVLPVLRHPDQLVAVGRYMAEVAKIPNQKLVALAAAMGSGKTTLIAEYLAPLLAAGVRVVLITHRTSLGAALAKELGLPWADEGAPGSDLRQQGVGLCIDSLCGVSAMRIRPEEWRDCVVVIDECTAVLAHALLGKHTAVAKRRPAVFSTLLQLLHGAQQVLVADAQLDNAALQALEAATGARAWLIGSGHQPAAGRELHVLPSSDTWRGTFEQKLQQRQRLWVAVTAKTGRNSAQKLAEMAMRIWPGIRVLVVDSDTVSDPDHPAYQLAADPNGIASQYDLILATPALAAGVSITIRGHFNAVMVLTGGTTDAAAVAQAAARVRDGCPRYLYAPQRSPGNRLLRGCGSCDPEVVLQHLGDHGALAGQLLAAGGCSLAQPSLGPWLPLFAQLVAQQNAINYAFAATVVGLLEREGYNVIHQSTDRELEATGEALAQQLQQLAELEHQAERALIQNAAPLSDQEAQKLLEKRRSLNPAQKAQLARWRINKTWGLGDEAPTAAVLDAHEQGMAKPLQFRWMLTTTEGRSTAAQLDLARADELGTGGQAWLPDLVESQHGPRLQVADSLRLPQWLQRHDWFTADDAQLADLHDRMVSHGMAIVQVLGITAASAGGNSKTVGKRRTTTLRRLLALVGYRLEARQQQIDGQRAWHYRVVPLELPEGCDWNAMQAEWAKTAAQKSPLKKGSAI